MPDAQGPFDNALQPVRPAGSDTQTQTQPQPEDRLTNRMHEPALPIGQGEDALHVGIDLGTSRTSISASNGQRHTVRSWVGYPKDIIARKRVGTKTLIGQAALDNRLALDMIKPLKTGVTIPKDLELGPWSFGPSAGGAPELMRGKAQVALESPAVIL